MPSRRSCFVAVLLAVASMASTTVNAQNFSDYVYTKAGEELYGKTRFLPDGVQVNTKGGMKNVRASEIEKFQFAGEPNELKSGRTLALDGQYQSALQQLSEINTADLTRAVVQAEHSYLVALCKANLALIGQVDRTEAINLTKKAASQNSKFPHLYDCARLLGDLAISSGNADAAKRYYGGIARSRDPNLKIQAAYLMGVAHLMADENEQAGTEFDKVLNLQASNPQVANLKTLAEAGKATVLARTGKADAALKSIDGLIRQLGEGQSEQGARIYNARGACYEALNNPDMALESYLHTHLLYSKQADAHAKALTKLIQLWEKVGKPDLAAKSRSELKQRYPGFAAS